MGQQGLRIQPETRQMRTAQDALGVRFKAIILILTRLRNRWREETAPKIGVRHRKPVAKMSHAADMEQIIVVRLQRH